MSVHATTLAKFERMTLLKRAASLCLPLILTNSLQAQWRSTLYPENWQRPTETTSFYNDKLIQDFSYAGYKNGTQAIPNAAVTHNAVTGYSADPTGTNDSTVAIQNAIDAAGTAGGGVVYLPAGTYKISPQGSNAYCLRISKSNVVLRGAGATSTYLLNTATYMRQMSVIDVKPTSTSTGSSVLLTADLTGPTRRLPVATPGSFAVGDIVKIMWDLTDAWVVEHNQQTWWNAVDGYPSSAEYLREVVAVNQAQGWIEVDVPTRYTMKTRDNARVAKFTGQLTGTGVEALSIGNVQNPGTTWGENDFSIAGTAAYEVHDCYLVDMAYLRDSWVMGVRSYQPAGNTTTCHMLANGISLVSSHRVTVKDCVMGRPQYGGGGGNGYMYRLQRANDCLVQSCTSDLARHGFVVSHAGTSGNVFLQCNDREAGQALGSSSTPYNTGGSGSDNHMHFSHSNLWDSCTAYNAYFTAHHRTTSGTIPHGLTSAHGVYWNISGSGTRYTNVVTSEQARYGYVIGTSGSKSAVSIISGSTHSTLPTDHSEGVGTGATLYPQSLYLDQLERRLRPVVTYKGNGSTGGTVPTDANNPYAPGATVTIMGAGTMVRTGCTFAGWNTLADGTGTDYAASSTFSIDNHLILYAKWTPATYTVTFNANGGGTPSSTSASVTYGAAYGTLPTTSLSGHTFVGWFTSATGGTQVIGTTTVSTAANHTLYARWSIGSTAAVGSIDAIVGAAQASAADQPGYYANKNSGLAGGTGSGTTFTRYSMVPLVGFTLPTLPAGHTIDSVTLRYNITKFRYQDNPTFTADSYLLNSSDPSGSGTGFYYMGPADPNPNTKLIGSIDLPDATAGADFTPASPIPCAQALSGNALATFKGFYTGNTPNQAEAFVRFNRSSVDGALTASQIYERFYVDSTPANLYLEITSSGPAVYTVTYNGNGNTGGAVPAAQTKTHGFDLTLSGNSGALVKTGYTFGGWNTSADGSGTNYAEGASYTADATLTLYAKWLNAFEAWVAANGTGNETFSGDYNNDGVADGMAWLLGVDSPGQSAQSLLPSASENNRDLIVSFKQRKATSRGTAILALQYSNDLGITDAWTNHTVTVPDTSSTAGGVNFVITPVADQDYNLVQATLPASAAGATGKVFMRLSGESP